MREHQHTTVLEIVRALRGNECSQAIRATERYLIDGVLGVIKGNTLQVCGNCIDFWLDICYILISAKMI